MSTSPTKGDGVLPPPSTFLRLDPPPGRRGHAHRRSGAISCHDIQSILQTKDANAPQRSGSAPVTPMGSEQKPFFPSPSQIRETSSQTALRPSFEQSEASVQPGGASPRRPIPRVRVGFADRVEYIRPLSTISSETESSMSTVRGHSTHSSLTSVLSGGPSSPPSARVASRPMLDTTYEDTDARHRPQSAGNILDTKSKAKDGFHLLPHFGARPRSEHGIPKEASDPGSNSPLAKRKSFGWWDHAKAYPTRAQASRGSPIPSSSSEPSLIGSSLESPLPSPRLPPSVEDEAAVLGIPARVPKSPRKPRKEPRKVKSWANSIISRKARSYHAKDKVAAVRPATPPPAAAPEEEPSDEPATDNFEPDFDADNTITIISTPSPKRTYVGETRRDNRDSFDRDSGSASPVIDLDAALGPFNTPPLAANARGSGRRPPPARRSMHSLGASYNNHRRAESAPELPPFEVRGPKKAPSFMEDVFEEEDEEESGVGTHGATVGEAGPESNNLAIEATENLEDSDVTESTSHKTVDQAPETEPITVIATAVTPIQHCPEIVTMQAPLTTAADELDHQDSHSTTPGRGVSPVEVVEDYEEPRACLLDKDSDSTLTPTLTPDGPKEPQALLMLGLAPATRPITMPDTIGGSAFSTPELGPVQVYEPTRLGTAHSSIAENRSLSFGEPGPEVRMSVDDVPSLTSSRSTATSPANYAFGRPGSAIYADQFPRAQSIVSSASFIERTRKRSSIASLSRLVGLERSKLNIESRPQSQHMPLTTSAAKPKKTKRLSKLLNFWKPKNTVQRGDQNAFSVNGITTRTS